MPQADASNSRLAPEPPPPECLVNSTLDPGGRAVMFAIETKFGSEDIAEFKSVFLTNHAIADEIERLLVILDALDGDTDFEMNVGNDDPRLDDAEGDDADAEPSLASFGGLPMAWCQADLEDDPAESGIADADGVEEQTGRAA
jgi:hypothetical protein